MTTYGTALVLTFRDGGASWFIVGIIIIAIVGGLAWYFWPSPGGGAGGGGVGVPGPQDKGDCNIGGHHSNMTYQECKDQGGSSFQPDNPKLPKVDPQTGNPL
jgi:hypothetical protein